jgi:sugar phosphate isomerase/epimerase
MNPDTFRRRLDALGLQVPAALFTPLSRGDDLRRFLDQQQALGNEVVVTGLGPDEVASPDALERATERYNAVAEIVHGRGMSLGYHNHWWEFTPAAEGGVPMDVLLERLDPRIFLELDVYWVRAAGLDPVTALKELGARVRRLHVKDGPGTVPAPGSHEAAPQTAVGSGALDIPAVLAAAPYAEWHVVELDECATDMFEAVEESYHYLTRHGLSRGREVRA